MRGSNERSGLYRSSSLLYDKLLANKKPSIAGFFIQWTYETVLLDESHVEVSRYLVGIFLNELKTQLRLTPH